MVIFGPLADFIPIQTLLIVSGLIMAGCSLTIIQNKALAMLMAQKDRASYSDLFYLPLISFLPCPKNPGKGKTQ